MEWSLHFAWRSQIERMWKRGAGSIIWVGVLLFSEAPKSRFLLRRFCNKNIIQHFHPIKARRENGGEKHQQLLAKCNSQREPKMTWDTGIDRTWTFLRGICAEYFVLKGNQNWGEQTEVASAGIENRSREGILCISGYCGYLCIIVLCIVYYCVWGLSLWWIASTPHRGPVSDDQIWGNGAVGGF